MEDLTKLMTSPDGGYSWSLGVSETLDAMGPAKDSGATRQYIYDLSSELNLVRHIRVL